jgi:hypothetical protein
LDKDSKVSAQLVINKVLLLANVGPKGRSCHSEEHAIIDLINDLERQYNDRKAEKSEKTTNKQRRRG